MNVFKLSDKDKNINLFDIIFGYKFIPENELKIWDGNVIEGECDVISEYNVKQIEDIK